MSSAFNFNDPKIAFSQHGVTITDQTVRMFINYNSIVHIIYKETDNSSEQYLNPESADNSSSIMITLLNDVRFCFNFDERSHNIFESFKNRSNA